jgi:hypothetical protein
VYVTRAVVGDKETRAVAKAIVAAAHFARPVVLVPAGRKLARDFVEVELSIAQQLGAASVRPLLEKTATALGIVDEIPIRRLAPDDARIIVDTARSRILLDSVPLVKLGENGYRLIKYLAERSAWAAMHASKASSKTDVAPTQDTDHAISGNRQTEGTTRNTVWKLKAWVKESFDEAGEKVPLEVAKKGLVVWVPKRGWKLAFKAWVR